MANASVVITLKTELTQALAQQFYQLPTSKPKEEAVALRQLFTDLASGVRSGSVDVATSSTAPVAASGSIAVTYANADADDTVTIGGVVLTAKTSGANGTTQFALDTDSATTAASLAACINANTTLSKHLTASAATGTVTVTAKQKGSFGNLIVMSTSDSDGFVLTQLTGGTGGAEETPVSYSLGI
jgi:phage tail sheath gpL-like